ncbi:MAG: ornithine cyclodeaminase family protein [Gammaproteobacteria bacterium]|nr:ornithine cyclodeaminase family protein [Gammaproteobacteria bacterium]
MNSPAQVLYLSRESLESLDITTGEVIECMEHLIRGLQKSRVWHAPKSVIQPDDSRYMMSTLSAADDPPYLAVKSVVLNPRNTDRGLPQINGLIMVLDSDTGIPVAVVDGNWVTAVRTAGASAIAARRLARPDSRVMAFIGCGVQAHSHLKLFADVFPLQEVRAFGRGSTNRDALCRTAEEMGLVAVASDTAHSAVDNADIIVSSVTITAKIDPFIDPRWLKPGAFISSTDMAIPWMREGMPALDRIIIDDREQESAMPNPMVDTGLISGDITDLVNGQTAGRTRPGERTAFVFRGIALGDLALAGLAVDKARAGSTGEILGPLR